MAAAVGVKVMEARGAMRRKDRVPHVQEGGKVSQLGVPVESGSADPSDLPVPLVPVVASDEQAETLRINIRPATGDDVPWIYRSWLNNFREKGSCTGTYHRTDNCVSRVRGHVHFDYYRKLMMRLTSRPGVVTLVACPSDNEGQVLGWLCAERLGEQKLALHYCHVKSEWRRKGVAGALVKALGPAETVFFTHHTKLSWLRPDGNHESCPLKAILPISWLFNPYIL